MSKFKDRLGEFIHYTLDDLHEELNKTAEYEALLTAEYEAWDELLETMVGSQKKLSDVFYNANAALNGYFSKKAYLQGLKDGLRLMMQVVDDE